MIREAPRGVAITRSTLRRMPLPPLDGDGDKDDRGRVLVAGGSRETPGAVRLAGVAALRAGAGKLQLATVRECAATLGLTVPEAKVVALPSTRHGEIDGARAARAFDADAAESDAVLIGPGMTAIPAARAMVSSLVRRMTTGACMVLDAAAIQSLITNESLLDPLGGRAVLTPHAGEMATLLGIEKDDVEANAPRVAALAAERFGAVVVLKGAVTWIAGTDGSLSRYSRGGVGLATSGSGDALSGLIAGLAARGAPAAIAAVWGVWAHGEAGRALARRFGSVGFLASELLAEAPRVLNHG